MVKYYGCIDRQNQIIIFLQRCCGSMSDVLLPDPADAEMTSLSTRVLTRFTRSEIVREVAVGLKYVHEKYSGIHQIVHRDFKLRSALDFTLVSWHERAC